MLRPSPARKEAVYTTKTPKALGRRGAANNRPGTTSGWKCGIPNPHVQVMAPQERGPAGGAALLAVPNG
eukprot:8802377-Lingulodinium_polyedra.AAC.1